MSLLPSGGRFLWISCSKIKSSFEKLSPSLSSIQRFFSAGSNSCVNEPICKHDTLTPPKGMSDSIFKKFHEPDEKLGHKGAHKCGEYKNAEYYAYHKYSFSSALVEILEIRRRREENQSQEADRICMKVIIAPEEEKKEGCEPAKSEEPVEPVAECKESAEKPEETKPEECKPEEPKPKKTKRKKKKKKKCNKKDK